MKCGLFSVTELNLAFHELATTILAFNHPLIIPGDVPSIELAPIKHQTDAGTIPAWQSPQEMSKSRSIDLYGLKMGWLKGSQE